MISVSVSVVSYFSDTDALASTIQSLAVASNAAEIATSLVIIDNTDDASDTPRLSQVIRHLADQGTLQPLASIELRQTGHNVGYGRANNVAQIGSRKDYVLVLNPDVELRPDALKRALRYMSGNPDCVLLAPRALDPSGRDLFLNHGQPSILGLLGRAIKRLSVFRPIADAVHRYELRDLAIDKCHDQTICASGCFMLMRRSAFVEAQGFDRAFFMYFEDYDLAVRIRKWGRLIYRPDVVLTHLGGGAAGKGFLHRRMFIASGVRFFRRHGWRWA